MADHRYSRASVAALVGANLLPLFGVAFLGWQLFPILLLYSLENIVIGFYNVLRMIKAPCDLDELKRTSQGINGKAGLIVFFCVHYGIFIAGHLFFTIMLFGFGHINDLAAGPMVGGPRSHYPIDSLQAPWIALGVASLMFSHGVSYVKNFIGNREYERTTCSKLFVRPYGRIIVLHVTILLGAFAVVLTGTPIALLGVFVLLKILMDVGAHLAERKKFQEPQGAET